MLKVTLTQPSQQEFNKHLSTFPSGEDLAFKLSYQIQSTLNRRVRNLFLSPTAKLGTLCHGREVGQLQVVITSHFVILEGVAEPSQTGIAELLIWPAGYFIWLVKQWEPNHLPAKSQTSLPREWVSSYVPFSFSYTKTIPGSSLGHKKLHTSVEFSSEQLGRRLNPSRCCRLFFLFASFFSGSTPSKEKLCLLWAEESFDAWNQSEATQLPKILRLVRLSLLVLIQSPNIQLSTLIFQIVCLHSQKDKFFTSGKKKSMDCAKVETQKSRDFQQGKLQGNWGVLRPYVFLVALLHMVQASLK